MPTLKIKKKGLPKKKPAFKKDPRSDLYLPTGSTLFNCACSDFCLGGYRKGRIVNIIGDSSSGKSLLSCTCLAEVHMHSKWDDYNLYYDDVEVGVDFDMSYMFGETYEDRVIIRSTDTVEEFYQDILQRIYDGEKFIYILDSLDALTVKEELVRAKQIREDGEASGSYKAEKAKMLKEVLRVTAREIAKTDSLLIIISQIIDNMGFGFTSKTRAGGHALKHFSSLEIWLKYTGQLNKTVNKKERQIGTKSKVLVSKNRNTGKRREVPLSIYWDYGVDDVKENLSWLVDEKVFAKRKNTIIAPELGLEGGEKKLIDQIEMKGLEKKLQLLVGRTWAEIEDKLKLNRKRRFK